MSASTTSTTGPEETTSPAPRGRRHGVTGRSSWCFRYMPRESHEACRWAACPCPCHSGDWTTARREP